MNFSDMMLPEFDYEMANTRKTLERVPEERFDWKPHDKSMSLRDLTTHLANIPTWAVHAISKESIDIAPVGGPPLRATPVESVREALETFDKNVAAAREAIAGASNEELSKKWTLLSGGNAVMTLPRVAVLRSFVMNHSIHHRAQLGVYLRLNDVAVPSIYGPSADEGSL